MTKNDKGSVTIIKAVENPNSKQAKDSKKWVGTRSPKIPFSTLLDMYYNSFITAWVTDKISTAISSGFDTTNDKLKKKLDMIDHEFLNRNKIVCWNAFFEIIRTVKGEITDIIPILNGTIEIMEDWDGYIQKIGTDTVYFNAFTPIKDRPARTVIYKESWATSKELRNTGKWCGYNPDLNEVYHFKNTSLNTKYYGASYFESVIDQIVLIEQIDKYYSKWFDNGMIKTKMLFPKWEKAKFTSTDKTVLKEFIKSKMKGLDKAFSTAILDNEIWQLDMEHDIDANAFIEYRQQLLKSVSIALNIPYDMLLSDDSNRASSQVAMESFNKFTIIPLQDQNLKDFKVLFAEEFTKDVETLKYKGVDTADEKEQMEVLTGYKKSGIMTANEIRLKLWLTASDDPSANVLTSDSSSQLKDQMTDLFKKAGLEFYSELTKIDHDISRNL